MLAKVKSKLYEELSSFNDLIQQIVFVIVTISTLFWLAVFLYGTFYFYYVPVVTQEKPVYFHFRVCDSGVGICSFPVANISLVKEGKNEVFKVGQPYKIVLDLDLPETEVNKNIGMFMVEMKLYNKRGEFVQTSARTVSSTLHYKSSLLQVLETLAFAPFFLFGYMNQKQLLHVELFPEFIDNAFNPSVGLVIEVQNRRVEIYSAHLKIFAQFSGLRYFLYYWPVTSAVIGISWNFMVICFIAVLSWFQFWLPRNEDNPIPSLRINLYKNRKPPSPRKKPKAVSAADLSGMAPETVGAEDETSLLRPATMPREDDGLRLRQSPRSVDKS